MRVSVAQLSLVGVAAGAATFDWNSIQPAKDLEYHDCYDSFKCARLQVPLDWKNETDTRTTAIAMIKYPAVVADTDPSFGGSIFGNPGGPGGSGITFLRGWGIRLQLIADKPGKRHYEFISWDPRGVGSTTPQSTCYHHNVVGHDIDLASATGNGALNRDDASLPWALAMDKNLGERCKKTEQEWGSVLPFVNTPSVARDMVEMIDKIDELRKRQAAAKSGKRHLDQTKGAVGSRASEDNVARLQYIGFSYGTLLGNYFASLYPGRVGRIVLDGVCNANDYSTGAGWLTNTVDTDEIFKKFLSGCHKAGPDVCTLAHTGESLESLTQRVWNWINRLNQEPVAMLQSTTGSSIILAGTDVLNIIGSVLYSPVAKFKSLATILEAGLNGNYTLLASALSGSIPSPSDACPVAANNATFSDADSQTQQSGVLCSDGDDITGNNLTWWRSYLKKQTNQSAVYGAAWADIRVKCSSWPFRPNWSFKGPFKTPKANLAVVKGQPAAPLLFLSNRLDPVTPLSAARAMAAGHPGAGVVVQESMGHSALGSAASGCTRRIVADYFDTGAVPSNETVCEAKCGPWDAGCVVFDIRNNTLVSRDAGLETDSGITIRKFPLGLM